MSNSESASESQAFWSKYREHFIAVNERGRIRKGFPMRNPDLPYSHAYQGPIDAGIENGHIIFFIHGGLNDIKGVKKRIERFAEETDGGFKDSNWHLIHLAWDTSAGSSINDIFGNLNRWRSWRNILRIFGLLMPWNWFGWRRQLRKPTAYFGNIMWKSNYDTAIDATKAPRENSPDRDSGFFRTFAYLSQRVAEGADVQISFVVHSAGAIVSNYILELIAERFPNLRDQVRNYILLAPACHTTHFQAAINASPASGNTAVLTLSPEKELADDIEVAEKSLLWAIYNLFEANWKRPDFNRYRLPLIEDIPVGDVRNRGLLGVEDLIAKLEAIPVPSFDRHFGIGVDWASTGEEVQFGTIPVRVWTNADTHGAFDDDKTTLESVKLLVA